MVVHFGLADDPNTRRHELGDPAGFKILVARFSSEPEARRWLREKEVAGFAVDSDERGWGSGYTYLR
jgi:hypothetical protein